MSPRLSGLEPELGALIQAARLFFGSTEGAFLSQLQGRISWEQLIGLAFSHGLTPLLREAVKRAPGPCIPDDVSAYLNKYYLNTVADNLALAAELTRLVARFDEAGLPVIAFKGPTLAQAAYGNLGLRPCSDLDILIPAKDFGRAEQVLLADRYRPANRVIGQRALEKRISLWISGQYMFVPASGRWSMDVHTAVMPRGYRYPVGFDVLFERSVEVSLFRARTVRTFAPEDLLQVLCFHGIKNRWVALKHVCDVAAVIRSTPGLSWELVLERARRMGGTRILLVGLMIVHELLAIALPPAVFEQVERDPQVRVVTDRALQHLLQRHSEPFRYQDRLRLYLSIQDNLANKLRYSLYTLMRRITRLMHRMG
jgi:hypothetical protein